MTPGEQYVAESIRYWVWSGFHDRDDVREMIEDVVEDDTDPDVVEAMIEPAFEKKREAEVHWPTTTACDRLDNVFKHLHEDGICALSYTGYEMSDGHADVTEAVAGAPEGHYHGYCFYHGQDVERAIDGHGLMIAFGELDNDPDLGLEVGHRVVDALRDAGLTVTWDETMESRIDLPAFGWQRRFDENS